MPRVLCAPFSVLESDLVGRLRANPPGFDRSVALITPSRRMADRLQRLVSAEHGLAFVNLRFHTFFSLALEIVESAGALDKTLIGSGLFHDVLVQKLLPQPVSKGLAVAYRASLRDLLDAGIEPGQWREHFGSSVTERESRNLERLLELQEKYEAALDKIGVITPSGLAALAGELVEDGKAKSLESYAELLYYGFYDLTGRQAEFLSSVARRTTCAIYFPYVKGHPAYDFAKRFLELKLPASAQVEFAQADNDHPRGELLENLFQPERPAQGALPTGLKIISASGARDEAWTAAKEALKLHGQGIPWGDIGIVSRALEPYRDALAQILSENGIPYWMGSTRPLLSHPLAKLCLQLLTLRQSDMHAQAVLDIVESPYFNQERINLPTRRFRRLVAALGVHGGWQQWKQKTAPYLAKDLDLDPGRLENEKELLRSQDTRALREFLEHLYGRLDPQSRRSWPEHAAAAVRLIEEHFTVSAESEQALALLERILKAVGELNALSLLEPSVSWDEFLEAFREAMARAQTEEDPPNQGVRVLTAMDGRGESFRGLIVLGLVEGLFPRQIHPDPLLGEATRQRLRHPAGYWIRPKLEGYEEEKLLFHLLISSAKEQLTLIYGRTDEDGRPQVPSLYLRELCRAGGFELEGRLSERVPRPPLAKLGKIPQEFLSPKEALVLAAQSRQDPLLAKYRETGEPHAWDGVTGPLPEYKPEFSPSAFNRFSACPFRFFATSALGLREEDPPAEMGELPPAVKGRVYHKILERFYRGLRASGFWEHPGSGYGRELAGALKETFDEYGDTLGLYPLLWEAHQRRLTRHVKAFVDADVNELLRTGFRPSLFEQRLESRLQGFAWKGTPDRIDVHPEQGRFRVVDYKTTWSKPFEKEVLGLKATQPFLYLELAAKAQGLGEPEAAVFAVVEGEAQKKEFPAALWRERRDALWANMGKLLGFLERGEFSISPKDGAGGHCRFCGFSSVCRKAHPATRRRAERSKWRERFDGAHILSS